jgi:diadenosine tetraphosphate (Ap4A) HIT family hydrolase
MCEAGWMAERSWPEDWESRKAGLNCPGCATERPAEEQHGVRFFATDHADAYLQRTTPAPGYSTVIFRGRHVADPTELTPDETVSFWSAVGVAAGAIRSVFDPCHLNYQLLGNEMPHVHVHIIPRYVHDQAPGRPLSDAAWGSAIQLSAEALASQVVALTRAAEAVTVEA